MTRVQSRRFVAVLVALMVGLSVLAAVLIARGWADDELQETVREAEAADARGEV